ncbi:hypothetical protein [uncultured Clostridium sp.]|nr:hypothetical protein [uncultured Clostridium sp.]
MKAITIRLTENIHKELKHLMINEETTFQDYVSALIEKELKKKGLI